MAEVKNPPGSGGLIAFGLVQIVVGVACAMLVLYIASGSELTVRQGPAGGAALASGMIVWGIATVYFFAAGVGSIKRRRWAQALTVVVSAMWLAAGVVSLLLLMVMLPLIEQRMHASGGGVVAAGVITGILLPLVLFLFYRRPAIRAICEAADRPRWTDRVPAPVLAVMIVLAFGALSMLANLANPEIALVGVNISGAPAAIALLALAILSAWLVVQCYRLRESAWWTLVLLQVIGVVVATISFMRSSDSDSDVFHSPFFIAIMIATWLAYFAFLLFIRRYFVFGSAPRTRREDAAPRFT